MERHFLLDTALIPAYSSIVSIVLLPIMAYWKARKQKNRPERLEKYGGIVKLWLEWLRVVLSVVLVCLASAKNLSFNVPDLHIMYILLLSVMAVASPQWNALVTKHVDILLLVTVMVYTYRDVFPLATFTLEPQDRAEGPLLWWKIGVVAVASALPLVMTRRYTPVDPNNPSDEPNPEQTASPISMLFFFFIDPVIFAASRVSHLPADQLPPLADYDAAKHLREKIREHVPSFNPPDEITSGNKPRHIFWSLLKLGGSDCIGMLITAALKSLAKFVVPLALNHLLRFLENDGEPGPIRPWFWIAMLFIGPTVASTSVERYMFLSDRLLTRIESVICQAVFSHALRMRMKSEVSRTETEGSTSEQPGKPSTSLVGKINNLVTTDVNNLLDAHLIIFMSMSIPLQLGVSLLFLYSNLGWSALVSFGVTLLFLPIPGFLANMMQKIQRERMKRTDERIQLVTETTKVIRMVKLFGWEAKMSERIAEKRAEELKWIKRHRYVQVIAKVVNFLIPVVTMMSCYFTFVRFPLFTVIMKGDLKPSIVFSSITIFDTLRTQCELVVRTLGNSVVAKVSLERINDFLTETELLDHFDPTPKSYPNTQPPQDDIAIHEALFTWSTEVQPSGSPSSDRRFVLAVDQETLTFKQNGFNLIVGPTGSGKTSLLMALLGEMHYIPVAQDSYVSLPRAGGVAYAAQEAWVLNETIRENIIFGSAFDSARYKKVLHQCALNRDLTLFEAGDQTEVGEKGITLSGGQKARITLARAVYSEAEVLLLDDVLAALDVHTAKWIVEKCFKGDLIKGRTVLLVTHNILLVAPLTDFAVSVKDGKITSQGALDAALNTVEALADEGQEQVGELKDGLEEQVAETDGPDNKPEATAKGQLIVAEEVQIGRVGASAAKLYASAFGGSHPLGTISTYLAGLLAMGALDVGQTWYLGYWAQQYEVMPISDVPVFRHLGTYGLLLLAAAVVTAATYTFFALSAVRASRTIHMRLIQSILTTTLRWLDTTPVSRIIARCTGDVNAVDMQIPNYIEHFATLALKMFTQLVALVFYNRTFILPALVLMVIGKWLGDVWARAVRCIRREQSNSKAPVLAQFDGAISGIVSIRAYGVQESVEAELRRRVDENVRTTRALFSAERWMPLRVDVLGALFSSSLAAYLVYSRRVDASTAGFSLNMAVSLSGAILYLLFSLTDLEIQANSLERIDGYLNIEREPGASSTIEPPAYWPASGELRVENLSARYSTGGPKVLQDLSFQVKSGERIGVVGRTGSGKSSLTLSLLRCIHTEGNVYYDGLDTSAINLDALRSNITIIPQMPELLSGTLRQNLDPFGQHDDAALNDVLRASGFLDLQDQDAKADKLTLDSSVSSGGSNLSVGERQILALARAILRKSKLLILDEATSAIDYATDTIIQKSLRTEVGSDTTVITIAHRLQTIMDADRIMVLDAGRIVEFDTPGELLTCEGGFLKALVQESADKDVLREMADKGTSREREL
ncbi:hypothetical protein E1B28_002661 [Marasmius oreades]|uniref:P-loop containing nucleoside triphosphate hydrolase protein n=1 Tax=Marasmius oreades TaxID=181124 RepID=A0A9P7RNI2_9AGAR|nr:uncharacterized protein E1B28_002661 [Marasmius oreades]KAG7086727.1 hypothetical protein E1B28_002661 [Marasmius oreades]